MNQVEIKLYDGIDSVSDKLRNSTFLAYINLYGAFQGVERVSGEEILNVFKELSSKSVDRCLFSRISLKRNGEWDEVSIIICNNIVVASAGEILGEEKIGSEIMQEIIRNINSNTYTRGIVENIEIPVKMVVEQLGVLIEGLKPPLEKPVEEKPSLKAEEKPPEIEEVIEEKSEVAATIPVETGLSRTEALPIEKKTPPPEALTPPQLPPAPRVEEVVEKEERVRKPVVIEELSGLDKVVIDLNDRMISLASSENVNITNAVVTGDPDKLEVEVNISKLGWGRKREKMMKLANSIADILTSILIKNRASQKELAVTVRHGYDAVKIMKKIKY